MTAALKLIQNSLSAASEVFSASTAAGLMSRVESAGLQSEAIKLLELTAQMGSAQEKKFDRLISSFADRRPETFNFSAAGLENRNTIGSVLNPQRSLALAVRLQELPFQTSENGSIKTLITIRGTQVLPELQLVPSLMERGAAASYINGSVKLPYKYFGSTASSQRTAYVVHEITHHEQEFLMSARLADQLGIGGADKLTHATAESLSAARDALRGVVAPDTMLNFLKFRDGRHLSPAASERADRLTASVFDLFNRPEYAAAIGKRMENILSFQLRVLDPASRPFVRQELQSLLRQGEESALARSLYSPASISSDVHGLRTQLPVGPVAKWNEEKFDRARDTVLSALDRTYLEARTDLWAWNHAYRSSLHEREASFNELIASRALAMRLVSI